jgi:DNA invertase Pin-like site-specific DNA recombinase
MKQERATENSSMTRDSTGITRGTGVIYARVSSEEQEKGFSIPAQTKLLSDYAVRNGIAVLEQYLDVESAKVTGRSGFDAMVKFFKEEAKRKAKDRRCRLLLVEKTDRLYRNLRDYITIDELDIEVHFVKENAVISPDSHSSEKFMHGIKVLMAKNYVDNLSEEVRKGMREKAEQGIWPAKAPLGYRNGICPFCPQALCQNVWLNGQANWRFDGWIF